MAEITTFDLTRLAGEATTNLTQVTVLSANGQRAAQKGFSQLGELAGHLDVTLPPTAAFMEGHWGNSDEMGVLELSPKTYGLLVVDVLAQMQRDARTIRLLREVPAGLVRGEACITQWGAERATLKRLNYIATMNSTYEDAVRIRKLARDADFDWGHAGIRRTAAVLAIAGGALWLNHMRSHSDA